MKAVRLNLSPRIIPGARIQAVDELKGLALLLVIVYHAGGVLRLPNYLHGEIGVDLFLLVSGFTLAAGPGDLSLSSFLQRRFLRIFPPYWIALIAFVWLNHRYFGAQYSTENLWLHLAGLHGFSRPEHFSAITESFWFISLIVAAYAVFAVLRNRLANAGWVIFACGATTLASSVYYMQTVHAVGLSHLTLRIPSFFLGVLAGRLLSRGSIDFPIGLPLGLGLGCFFYITFLGGGLTFPFQVPAIGLIVLWLAFRRCALRFSVGRKLTAGFALTGTLSYEIYLFHQPLIRDFNIYIQQANLGIPEPSRAQLVAGMLIGLSLTVVVSLLVRRLTRHVFRLPRSAAVNPS